jgi:hypothetical protein
MQGLLETPGLTVAGHLVHGQVKEAPALFVVSNMLQYEDTAKLCLKCCLLEAK